MDWATHFAGYVADPFAAWPPERPLQARKLSDCAARLAAAQGVDRDELVARLVAAAERRCASGPAPTLFLVNCGSSGSHWIEAMLASLPGFHACGEVYVPADPAFDDTSGQPWTGFLDALHQLHREDPARTVSDDDVLVNSAHSWKPVDLAGGAPCALLVRDPVDVVLSRTLRKPKLRRHVSPAADDLAYLEQNLAMVGKFYRSALRRAPATVLRYEEVLARPEEQLARLLLLVGRKALPEQLEAAAARHSIAAQGGAGARTTNLYQGERRGHPAELRDVAMERLSSLRSDLGYA